MGQKINPISIRLGYTTRWRSRWFDLKNYKVNLLQDYQIRQLINTDLRKASIARIEIERFSKEIIIKIYTSRPGVIIGRGGAGVEELRKKIVKIVGQQNIKIDILEVRNPEANAAIVANQIVEQIERRIPFRRAIRSAMNPKEKTNIDGIKIVISGRLNGAEIARKEMFINGKVPLHTFRHYIDYANKVAHTTYGTIGVKVWIFKEGDKDEDKSKPNNQK